jgi:hypothetical protein
MSKKISRSKITAGFNLDGLPTLETVDANVKAITPQATTGSGKTFSLEETTTPPPDRTPGLTAKGRVKFTTMIKPELRQRLETLAAKNHISTADVLETVILEYFNL